MKKLAIILGCLTGWSAQVCAQGGPQAGAQGGAQPMHWPHHKKATIVLTYDDALVSQLDSAVPQLKAAGFKATFFLTSDIDYVTIPRWRQLAREGFELGNHTLFHPCSPSPDNPVSSASYTQTQMIDEIDLMNRFLYALDGKTVRTFAYPCAETTAGGKDYVDSLRRTGTVQYARIGGDVTSVITDFAHLDSLRVPALGVEDHTDAATIIGFIKKVQEAGGMGVIMFHGVGGDYITTATDVHQAVLDYLKANQKEIWVATFGEAMYWAMRHK
ncbi:MAG TPA: polysaccharide deacetylase family protein [Puia sp.]|jgi:peptidoglycan/xylan/chitin deacetylase (PgdA/CDA1 family)|nr:polysaccharide deacetylase family protein [Puia sp.]